MNTRHESFKQELLNHVIMTINTYMIENVDSLVTDESLQEDLNHICYRIYRYLGMNVDTSNILSRHNLLSKDVVVFPDIQDPEASKVLNDQEFNDLIVVVRNILEKKAGTGVRKQILQVIEEYNLV